MSTALMTTAPRQCVQPRQGGSQARAVRSSVRRAGRARGTPVARAESNKANAAATEGSLEEGSKQYPSALRWLGEKGKDKAEDPKANKVEQTKNAKDPTVLWEEIEDLAAMVRSGEYSWEDLALDDIDTRMKWCGLFHRRKATPGRFMMRLRVPNGGLTSHQLRELAGFVERYGEHGCFDVTTRANLQLRGIPMEETDKAMELIQSIGLESKMSGMDNVRNLTGNPLAGIDPYEVLDTRPFCEAIQDSIVGHPEYSNLPRKFNIAVNATRDDFPHGFINDIALDAVRDPTTGEVRLNCHVGGYLSTKRWATSIPLNASIDATPESAAQFCCALIRVFRENGSRGNRQKCRVMWLIEEMGVDEFRRLVAQEMGVGEDFAAAVDPQYEGTWERRDLLGLHQQKDGKYWAGATIPVGRLQPGDLKAFADIAERFGTGDVRLTPECNLLIPNISESDLGQLIKEPLFQKFELDAGPLMRSLVACTGATFCGQAMIHTKEPAYEIARQLEASLSIPSNVRIHWSGCPNSCGQSAAGDIGLIGTPAKKNGKAVEGVQVLRGGTVGEHAELAAKEFDSAIPIEDAYDEIKRMLIEHYGATEKEQPADAQ